MSPAQFLDLSGDDGAVPRARSKRRFREEPSKATSLQFPWRPRPLQFSGMKGEVVDAQPDIDHWANTTIQEDLLAAVDASLDETGRPVAA